MILAMVLSLGVVILFMQVIIPWMAVRELTPEEQRELELERQRQQQRQGGAAAAPVESAPPKPAAVPALEGFEATPAQTEETLTFETPGLLAELTNVGASLKRLSLKTFPTAVDNPTPLILLDEFEEGLRTFQVYDKNLKDPDLRKVIWEIDRVLSTPARKVFRYARADGLVFQKTIEAGGGEYLLAGRLKVENRNTKVVQPFLSIGGAAGITLEGGAYYLYGVAGYDHGGGWSLETGTGPTGALEKPEEVRFKDGKARLGWLGVTDKYFAAVMMPTDDSAIKHGEYRSIIESSRYKEESARRGALSRKEEEDLREECAHSVASSYHLRELRLGPGETFEFAWSFYAGPKEPATLAPYEEKGLPVLVDWGFLSLRRVMLWMLLLFHALTGNYGFAIILLTFAVRLALFPISRKAQVSMFRMQKLAPQMKALQEKFKEDPQRMRAEIMALYKKHKASPAGGCLPLLLQLPIFIGLYNTLLFSIELRQAPFIFWIHDLAAPDRLCPLPFTILGQTDLNLLPILMLVPMIVQTALSPKPADPNMAQQQKMMMWMMPTMFLFICYTMPSGVSLYWFFSSLWGLVEIRMIKKFWLKDPPGTGAGTPAPAVATVGR